MGAHGRCMCGGVRYEIAGELRDVWNCHCHRCRQFTGHHMAATGASVDAVTFESHDTLTTGLRTVAAWWMAEHGDYHTPAPHLIEHEYDG